MLTPTTFLLAVHKLLFHCITSHEVFCITISYLRITCAEGLLSAFHYRSHASCLVQPFRAGVIFISAACSVLLLHIPNSIENFLSLCFCCHPLSPFLIQRIFSLLVYSLFCYCICNNVSSYTHAHKKWLVNCFRAHVRVLTRKKWQTEDSCFWHVLP